MEQIYYILHDWFELLIEEGYVKKTHWIWVDFFENTDDGFEHFKKELANDKDYATINFETITKEEAADIANEIQVKLSDSSFNSLVMLRQLGL